MIYFRKFLLTLVVKLQEIGYTKDTDFWGVREPCYFEPTFTFMGFQNRKLDVTPPSLPDASGRLNTC